MSGLWQKPNLVANPNPCPMPMHHIAAGHRAHLCTYTLYVTPPAFSGVM